MQFSQRLKKTYWLSFWICISLLQSVLTLAQAADTAPKPPSEAQTLKFGIFPYFSPSKLMRVHQPLAQHLDQHLPESVKLITAPNFKSFLQRTRALQYDVIFTAPHMGVLAEQQSGYQRLAKGLNRSHAVFVVPKQSEIQSLKDLVHKKLALPPERAIINKLAWQCLHEQKIDTTQINIQATRSHNNALTLVLKGLTDAAAFGLPTWRTAKPEIKAQLRVIEESPSIPGFMLLAHPSKSAEWVAEVQKQLMAFGETTMGNTYVKNAGLKGFAPIEDADVNLLLPYVEMIFPAVKSKTTQ